MQPAVLAVCAGAALTVTVSMLSRLHDLTFFLVGDLISPKTSEGLHHGMGVPMC
jgi:hypothetical protein